MLSLVVISKVNSCRYQTYLETPPTPSHALCLVRISGAVRKPGSFKVYPGTPLKTVLKKSLPKPSANLRRFFPHQAVEESMEIQIEELSEIIVSVVGLSEAPLTLTLPIGSKVSDLKDFFDPSCKSFFKSYRLLKDGESLVFSRGKSKNLQENTYSSNIPYQY